MVLQKTHLGLGAILFVGTIFVCCFFWFSGWVACWLLHYFFCAFGGFFGFGFSQPQLSQFLAGRWLVGICGLCWVYAAFGWLLMSNWCELCVS